MPKQPTLYRKRLIPLECNRLDKDELIFRNASVLITRWHTIRPKKDLDHGSSCYLLDRGWKISRFLNRKDEQLCWYCDIIEHSYDRDTDTYVFTDLLADVIIYPSGAIHVVDLNEIADAFEQGLLSAGQACSCMRKLDALLNEIYHTDFLSDLQERWPVK